MPWGAPTTVVYNRQTGLCLDTRGFVQTSVALLYLSREAFEACMEDRPQRQKMDGGGGGGDGGCAYLHAAWIGLI